METEVRPSKRPRTGGERAVTPPNPSDDCLCPICLDPCTPDRSFALPCCNGQLAEGEGPKLIHKACMFAYARSVFEQSIQRESLMLMTNARLNSILRCPCCRAAVPMKSSIFGGLGGIPPNLPFGKTRGVRICRGTFTWQWTGRRASFMDGFRTIKSATKKSGTKNVGERCLRTSKAADPSGARSLLAYCAKKRFSFTKSR